MSLKIGSVGGNVSAGNDLIAGDRTSGNKTDVTTHVTVHMTAESLMDTLEAKQAEVDALLKQLADLPEEEQKKAVPRLQAFMSGVKAFTTEIGTNILGKVTERLLTGGI